MHTLACVFDVYGLVYPFFLHLYVSANVRDWVSVDICIDRPRVPLFQ